MNLKKYLAITLLLTTIFSNQTFAVSEVQEKVVSVDKKGFVDTDLIKVRIGEFLKILENTRLHYADYFKKVRDENKAGFSGIEIKDLDKQPKGTDIAGVQQPKTPTSLPQMDEIKSHFKEYALYFLGSSLFSFFNNKAVFYAGLVLLTLVFLRFILRRFL